MALVFVFYALHGGAAQADALLAGGKLCTQHFGKTEAHYGIPLHLLTAISSAESGRWHKGMGVHVPWPWTINVEGKGYFFDSKEEAIAKTAEYIRQGKRSIDVGCMQVNLKHHPTAFRSLNEAFSPAHNVAYAAKFLREHYARTRDWVQATAHYHSRTPKFGKRYLARVQERWQDIVGKVAQAKGAGREDGYKVVSLDENPLGAGRYQAPENGIASTRNVKVIQVHNDAPRNDVMVVSPAARPPASAVKQADDTESSPLVKGRAARMVTRDVTTQLVDNAARSSHIYAHNPFVFAN